MPRIVSALVALSTVVFATGALADEPERWVAGTPDQIIDVSLKAALAGGPDALARTLLIATFEERAAAGKAHAALEQIGKGSSAAAGDARWLARMMDPEPALTWHGMAHLDRDGGPSALLRTFAILGPFEDTGGGIKRAEGPDAPGARWAGADYSYGVFAVRTGRSLVDTVTPRGLPLDLYVSPRSESCTYLASVVTLPAAAKIGVHVASAGSLRVDWDGAQLLVDEHVAEAALVDRFAVRVDAGAGDHLLKLKVCSGARADSGRVRVRFTDEQGADLALAASSDPERIDAVAAKSGAEVKYQRTATALETGSKTSDTPAPDEALIAAVLLELGGADDLRSQRAPGLLDHLVGSAGLTADRLALAGFLAPVAANKSGWLQKALTRAKSAGDDGTAGFAQRALVVLRLGNSAPDLALATAEEAPLAVAKDAHARWLRARVWSALGARGLNHKARLELEAIIDKHKGKTPLVVWRELSRSSGHNAEELEAHTHLAEGTAGDRGPAFIGAHRYLGKRTLERIALRSLLHQDSLDDLVRVGDMLQDAGRYPAAKQVFTLATELGPNRADAFTGFAKAMRAMSPGEPAGPMSLDALARASELDPEDARLAAEVRFRRGDDSFAADPGLDAPWLIEPKVFLARAKEKPAPATGVFSRQLHWRRVVRLHSDKRVSQMMHYAREIIVEPRTENERYEGLPGGYGSELLVARVHKKDGTVLAPEEEDTAGPVIRWPPLERGDVVEVAIRTWTEGPVGRRGDAPFYFVDYVGSVDTNPILYNDVVIDAPLGSPLAYDVVGGSADEVKQSESNGRSITQLVWSNPPSIADEPLSPKVSELMPLVVGSIYPSWKSFLGWYEGAIEGFVKPDEQMKRLAEEITQGKKTREEKVEALFTYVADDIRYVNYQSGEWWLPNRPQELLARRQGDCDDKAMLLITLLQAVGIEAKEVLVQTRYTAERRVMESTKVAIPMFDHGIVWLPDESGEGGRYLDATSPQSRYGSLPGMDGGAMVLMVGGEGKLVEAPAPAPADQGVESQWTLELASDGSGKVVANETHVGDNGFYLRMFLGEEDTRAQWVEGNLLNGWFTAVEMDPKVTFDGALPKGAAKVSYSLRSKALARREGHDLIVAVAPATPVTSMLAPLTTRTLPVELPPSAAPQHRRLTMTIVAPASHQFAEAPPDGEADGGAFGKASLEFTLSKDKRKLTVVRDVSLAQWRIPVAEYAAWRKWLQQIDGLFQRGVRLTQK